MFLFAFVERLISAIKKPHRGGASQIMRNVLLGVGNTAILKCWMHVSSDMITACVVVLVAVGELNALLG